MQSTLHALSLIISFYSSVQSLSVTSYARQAPRQLTAQLQLEVAKYDAVCAQLEQRIVRLSLTPLPTELQADRDFPTASSNRYTRA